MMLSNPDRISEESLKKRNPQFQSCGMLIAKHLVDAVLTFTQACPFLSKPQSSSLSFTFIVYYYFTSSTVY